MIHIQQDSRTVCGVNSKDLIEPEFFEKMIEDKVKNLCPKCKKGLYEYFCS